MFNFKNIKSVRTIALLTSLIALPLKSSGSTDFDFSGTFEKDNDVVLLDFTVGSDSTITIFSSSWDDGGLDPILAIWDSNGDLVEAEDDGEFESSTSSNGVLYSHGVWDSHFDVFLSAGGYKASIAQFDNFNVGSSLSKGFTFDDNPNFTFNNGWGSQEYFNGVFGENDSDEDPRTGDWVFHILNVEEAIVVPAPGAVWLFGSGLVALVNARIRRTKI